MVLLLVPRIGANPDDIPVHMGYISSASVDASVPIEANPDDIPVHITFEVNIEEDAVFLDMNAVYIPDEFDVHFGQ